VRRVTVTISALLALAVVGVVVPRSGGGGSSTPAVGSVPADAQPAEASPAEPPPQDAATAAVASTGDVVDAGLISRRELIESFTTPAFGAELADLTSEQVTSMELAMTETGRTAADLSVAEFPLRARTTARDATTATVEVWSVLVVSSIAEAVARQTWRTVTVDLELVDGRWLVDGWESAEGPSPAATPEAAIASGADVADVLAWEGAG
jgi:hypothetical protein